MKKTNKEEKRFKLKSIYRSHAAEAFFFVAIISLWVFSIIGGILIVQNIERNTLIHQIAVTQGEIKAKVEAMDNRFSGIEKMSLRVQRLPWFDEEGSRFVAMVVYYYSIKNDLDPWFTWSVIKIESSGHPQAISHAGARGMMQVMYYHTEEDLMDVAINIKHGTRLLREALDKANGDLHLALLIYHAGERVKYGDESKIYAKRVMKKYGGKYEPAI